MLPAAIVELLIAIDWIVVRPKKEIQNGIISPPPPEPPLLASPKRNGNMKIPMISCDVCGKRSLC